MRFKMIALLALYLFISLLTACHEELEDIATPIPDLSSLVTSRFEVSTELDVFTQAIDSTYFNKHGRYLFSDEHWWLDYGTDKDSSSDKELHQYIYLKDIRSYLDPNITVFTDESSGSIVRVNVKWSETEMFTEQTAQTFEDYFNCVAAFFIPDISDGRLDKLLKDLRESENRKDHQAEPYPTTIYFTDNVYCYAYFKDGVEVICFSTEVYDKLPEYKANNVNCIEIIPKSTAKAEIDLSYYFGSLAGSVVFLDTFGNYTIYNNAASEMRTSPCSTFKIISTLAAFEYGAVTPSQSVIEWDGTKWSIDSWNKDLSIDEAFKSSCVWYYRKLIDRIGKDNMESFLESLNYGNLDISPWEGSGFNNNALIDGFWLESSLLISPQEQVDIIHLIFEGKTDINDNHVNELKKMMYKENDNSNYKLYGKTGSGRGGWFVGFFELDGDNTYFAVYLNEQEDVNGPKAQEIAEKIIEGYFIKTSR